MTSTFKIAAAVTDTPGDTNASGAVRHDMTVQETEAIARRLVNEVTLSDDNPVALALGGLASVNVIVIRTTGAPVRVSLTGPGGAAQVVSVDPLACIVSRSEAYTAITVARQDQIETTVSYYLGERS